MAKLTVVKTPDETPAGLSDEGPFRCDHCEYFSDGVCSKPQVLEEHPELETEGGASVQPTMCCNFFSRADRSSVKRRGR